MVPRRLVLALLAGLPLAACNARGPASVAAVDPDAAWYIGSMPDQPFDVPLVDRSRMDPKYRRQTVAYMGLEKPGTVVVDIDERHLEEAMKVFPAGDLRIHFTKHDVMDRDAWTRVADEIEKKFGLLQVLVNNAGVGLQAPASTGTLKDWEVLSRLGAVDDPILLTSGRHDEATPTQVAEIVEIDLPWPRDRAVTTGDAFMTIKRHCLDRFWQEVKK